MTEFNGVSVYADEHNGGILVTLHQDPPPRDKPRQRGRLTLSWEDARHLVGAINAILHTNVHALLDEYDDEAPL